MVTFFNAFRIVYCRSSLYHFLFQFSNIVIFSSGFRNFLGIFHLSISFLALTRSLNKRVKPQIWYLSPGRAINLLKSRIHPPGTLTLIYTN